MIAAVCTWHEHHVAAVTQIEQRLDRGERLKVPAPALAESYAVLTRLPSPHRLSPSDAWALVETNFILRAGVVGLNGIGYAKLLGRLAKTEVSGGRTYDAVIAECAKRSRASVLLTFNRHHFGPPLDTVTVIDPSAPSRI